MGYKKEIEILEGIARRAEERGDTKTYEAAQRCITEAIREDLKQSWGKLCQNYQAS